MRNFKHFRPFARIHTAWIAIILVVWMGSAQASTQRFSARVTHVSDGDTLWAERADTGQRLKIRLQGIDAPELCQAWGAQSREALRTRVLRQNIEVSSRARDDYGRVLARVHVQGSDLGAWLVSQGHAWNDRNPNRHAKGGAQRGAYPEQEEAARASRSALWSQPSPERPRDFRKRHGPCQ
jgi:micrococcal nuclease